MSELKQCPFCGGRAELQECPDTLMWFVSCGKCLASSVAMAPVKASVDELLAERWNKRVATAERDKEEEE